MRYYVIFCSPKKDLTVDHMRKIQPDLDKAVELFNKLHPGSPIVTGGNDKTIKAKELDKEFDRILNGEKIHYSQIVGLSLQESVVNAGYTAHLLFVDKICSR